MNNIVRPTDATITYSAIGETFEPGETTAENRMSWTRIRSLAVTERVIRVRGPAIISEKRPPCAVDSLAWYVSKNRGLCFLGLLHRGSSG